MDIMSAESLPEGWSAGIGCSSDSHYTRPFYNDEEGLEMRVYWDKGHKHKAVVYEVEVKDNGDRISGYPVKTRKAGSEDSINEKAFELMKECSSTSA